MDPNIPIITFTRMRISTKSSWPFGRAAESREATVLRIYEYVKALILILQRQIAYNHHISS